MTSVVHVNDGCELFEETSELLGYEHRCFSTQDAIDGKLEGSDEQEEGGCTDKLSRFWTVAGPGVTPSIPTSNEAVLPSLLCSAVCTASVCTASTLCGTSQRHHPLHHPPLHPPLCIARHVHFHVRCSHSVRCVHCSRCRSHYGVGLAAHSWAALAGRCSDRYCDRRYLTLPASYETAPPPSVRHQAPMWSSARDDTYPQTYNCPWHETRSNGVAAAAEGKEGDDATR